MKPGQRNTTSYEQWCTTSTLHAKVQKRIHNCSINTSLEATSGTAFSVQVPVKNFSKIWMEGFTNRRTRIKQRLVTLVLDLTKWPPVLGKICYFAGFLVGDVVCIPSFLCCWHNFFPRAAVHSFHRATKLHGTTLTTTSCAALDMSTTVWTQQIPSKLLPSCWGQSRGHC